MDTFLYLGDCELNKRPELANCIEIIRLCDQNHAIIYGNDLDEKCHNEIAKFLDSSDVMDDSIVDEMESKSSISEALTSKRKYEFLAPSSQTVDVETESDPRAALDDLAITLDNKRFKSASPVNDFIIINTETTELEAFHNIGARNEKVDISKMESTIYCHSPTKSKLIDILCTSTPEKPNSDVFSHSQVFPYTPALSPSSESPSFNKNQPDSVLPSLEASLVFETTETMIRDLENYLVENKSVDLINNENKLDGLDMSNPLEYDKLDPLFLSYGQSSPLSFGHHYHIPSVEKLNAARFGRIVYWVHNCFRIEHNQALASAVWLSNTLNIPLMALVVLEKTTVRDCLRNNQADDPLNDISPHKFIASVNMYSYIRKSVIKCHYVSKFRSQLEKLNIPLLGVELDLQEDVQQDKEKLVSMLSKLQSSTPGKIFAVITDAWSSSLSMKAVLNQFETSSSLDGVLDSLAVIGFDDSGYLDGKLINEFANEAHSAHFKDHLWSLYSCSRGYQLPQLAPLSRKLQSKIFGDVLPSERISEKIRMMKTFSESFMVLSWSHLDVALVKYQQRIQDLFQLEILVPDAVNEVASTTSPIRDHSLSSIARYLHQYNPFRDDILDENIVLEHSQRWKRYHHRWKASCYSLDAYSEEGGQAILNEIHSRMQEDLQLVEIHDLQIFVRDTLAMGLLSPCWILSLFREMNNEVLVSKMIDLLLIWERSRIRFQQLEESHAEILSSIVPGKNMNRNRNMSLSIPAIPITWSKLVSQWLSKDTLRSLHWMKQRLNRSREQPLTDELKSCTWVQEDVWSISSGSTKNSLYNRIHQSILVGKFPINNFLTYWLVYVLIIHPTLDLALKFIFRTYCTYSPWLLTDSFYPITMIYQALDDTILRLENILSENKSLTNEYLLIRLEHYCCLEMGVDHFDL